jgi:hypothetical protein
LLTRAVEFVQRHNLDVIILLTLCHWAALSLGVVEWFFRGWFWKPTENPAGSPLIIAAILLLFAGALWVALRSWRRPVAAVAVLVLCGFGIQMSLAFTEGRGLDAVRDRIVETGHAELLEVAAREPSIWAVLDDYEQMVDNKRLGEYAASKPPGQLLVYMLSYRAAGLFHRSASAQDQLEWARTFAAVTWPLISYLVLFPIFYLVRAFANQRRALIACLLYLCIPSVNLITLHTDQTFFPLFFLLPILTAVMAFSRKSLTYAALTGVAWYAATFLSFPLAIAAAFAVAATIPYMGRGEGKIDKRQSMQLWGVAVGAALVVAVVVWSVLGYDMVTRYRGALEYHEQWKHWEAGARSTFYYGVSNVCEFALWLGIPMSALVVWRLRSAVADAMHRRLDASAAMALVLLAAIVFLLLFGHTKGEVARLWLFSVPIACILAAEMLESRFGDHLRYAVVILVGLQAITVYLAKRFQDFH